MELSGVQHDRERSQLFIALGEHRAVLDYRLRGNQLDAHHTFVPPELRGRGLAEQLTRQLLDFCRDQQLHVLPTCSYVAEFVRRNPPAGVVIDTAASR